MTRQQGYRGAMSKLDISGDWGVKLAEIKSLSDISPEWRMAVVLETSDQSARIGFQPNRELGGAVSKQRETGLITLDGVRWARPTQGNFKWQDAEFGGAGPAARRRDLRRSALQQGGPTGRRPVPAPPDPGSIGRDGGDGPLDRPRAGDGRRLLVRPEPVQPRHAGLCDSPARRSSRSSIQPRSTMATRRRRWCSTRRSKSTRGRAPVCGGLKTSL